MKRKIIGVLILIIFILLLSNGIKSIEDSNNEINNKVDNQIANEKSSEKEASSGNREIEELKYTMELT